MKKVIKPLLISSSFSFLIFGLIFQIFGSKFSLKDIPEGDEPISHLASKDQTPSSPSDCITDKNGDGKIELSMATEVKEDRKFDCLLFGCNIYEFE